MIMQLQDNYPDYQNRILLMNLTIKCIEMCSELLKHHWENRPMKGHLDHVLQFDKVTGTLVHVYQRTLHSNCNIPFDETVKQWITLIEEFFDRWLAKSREQEITYEECFGFICIIKELKEVYTLLKGKDLYKESELDMTKKLKDFKEKLFLIKDELLPLTQLPDDEAVIRYVIAVLRVRGLC